MITFPTSRNFSINESLEKERIFACVESGITKINDLRKLGIGIHYIDRYRNCALRKFRPSKTIDNNKILKYRNL